MRSQKWQHPKLWAPFENLGPNAMPGVMLSVSWQDIRHKAQRTGTHRRPLLQARQSVPGLQGTPDVLVTSGLAGQHGNQRPAKPTWKAGEIFRLSCVLSQL